MAIRTPGWKDDLTSLTNREIPIIADDYVDAEFGSGCVKITPAHDFNDYAMGERHQLPMINILTADAHLNDDVPESFRGMARYEGRKAVVEAMDALGLLEKVEDHRLKVPRGDRSGVVIEPWLTLQWYVDAKKLAWPAIEAVESGANEFVPKQWENTYFAWMRDIQDWCIAGSSGGDTEYPLGMTQKATSMSVRTRLRSVRHMSFPVALR